LGIGSGHGLVLSPRASPSRLQAFLSGVVVQRDAESHWAKKKVSFQEDFLRSSVD